MEIVTNHQCHVYNIKRNGILNCNRRQTFANSSNRLFFLSRNRINQFDDFKCNFKRPQTTDEPNKMCLSFTLDVGNIGKTELVCVCYHVILFTHISNFFLLIKIQNKVHWFGINDFHETKQHI